MVYLPDEIRGFPRSDASLLHIPTFPMGSEATPPGISPGQLKNDVEISRQASRPFSPESSRRKRLSIFSRSSSDAQRPKSATMIAHLGPAIDPLNTPALYTIRPATSGARAIEGRPKRPSDPLESIRISIFGGRKSTSSDRPSSRSSHRSRKKTSVDATKPNVRLIPSAESPRPRTPPQTPRRDQSFNSPEEYYHHRKKSSISPPFNFQHVTHTAKKHLPSLDTVDEKDLKNKFWTVNALQTPREQLSGIKAEDLGKDQARSMSPGARAALPSRPRRCTDPSQSGRHTITRSLDETLFDETQETKFDPDQAYQSLGEVNQPKSVSPPQPRPEHHSSMSVLSLSTAQSRFEALRSHSSLEQRTYQLAVRGSAWSSLQAETLDSAEKAFALPTEQFADQSFREKQPLHSLPDTEEVISASQTASSRSSPSDSQAPSLRLFSLFPAPPGAKMDYPASIRSKRSSKRSSKSAGTVQTTKSASYISEVPSEHSWEDDVDFAYEQAAEAMCDFDWESVERLEEIDEDQALPSFDQASPHGSGGESNGGVRLPVWIKHPSGFASEATMSSRQRSSGYASSLASVDQQRKRGSSVGHKGFLAARSASENVITKSSPSLSLNISAAQLSNTSSPPQFSVIDPDLEHSNYESPYNLSFVHIPTFDTISQDYLSDPESARTGGSRHRKSSSYSSYGSSTRSLPLVRNRWTSVSTSSSPEFIDGKRRSRSSVRQGRISRILLSVPRSPDVGDSERESDKLAVPEQEPLIMRRPATSGDRELLFAAGRTVQRGRSSTPNRSLATTPKEGPGGEEVAGWI